MYRDKCPHRELKPTRSPISVITRPDEGYDVDSTVDCGAVGVIVKMLLALTDSGVFADEVF